MSEPLQPGAVPDYESLDADAAEHLRQVNASPWDYRNTPIPEMRAGAAAVRKQLYAKWPNAVEQMRDMVIHQDGLSIPVRVYVPASDQAPLPVCLYFHGGGFVFTDDLEVFDPTAGSLASGGSCIVMSVNYRLAPEHPFPAAVDDCYAALTWVANNAASLGGDPSRLAVAGESAGGNLAAACALLARDRQGPELRLQLLHCPVVDAPEPERPSYQKYGKGYMLTEDLMAWFVELYIQQPDDLVNPNFALLRAASFKGVAPAVIITAECDPLHDEGQELAKRLQADGVPVEYTCYTGVMHGFIFYAITLKKGQAALDQSAAALRKAFW